MTVWEKIRNTRRVLSQAELTGKLEIISVYGIAAGYWIKLEKFKPGEIVWTFRVGNTLLVEESGRPDLVLPYDYQSDGKLVIKERGNWIGDVYYLFADPEIEGEAELYSLVFDSSLENCKVKFRLRRLRE